VAGDAYTATLRFSYELDFWGRAANAVDAAEQRVLAGAADLQSAVLSVIAETIRAYFQIVALEQRLDLARAEVDLLGERLTLTERRYAGGLVDSFELYTIAEAFRTAEAAVPRLQARIYAAQARLATLTGAYPGSIADDLAAMDPLRVRLSLDPVPPGLPAALLIQRPDVRAGWRRLEAARFAVGEARAARLPRLTLTGGAGLQGDSPGALADTGNWFANFVAGLTAPILTGGRLAARADAAEAALAEQAQRYAATVLTAMREVETALKEHRETASRYRLLLRQLANARSSADLQLNRYTRGIGDYLGFLDARRNLVGARRAVVEAEQALAEARLSVHRALGGVWVAGDPTLETRALFAAALGEETFAPVAALPAGGRQEEEENG